MLVDLCFTPHKIEIIAKSRPPVYLSYVPGYQLKYCEVQLITVHTIHMRVENCPFAHASTGRSNLLEDRRADKNKAMESPASALLAPNRKLELLS